MSQFKYLALLALTTALLSVAGHPQPVASAPTAFAPSLGKGAQFVVLGSSTFTNIGAGVYVGDVGSALSTVVGFPLGILRYGAFQNSNSVAVQAQSDAKAAYNVLKDQSCNVNLTNQNLGGLTLTAGVYCFSAKAHLTGVLVLDGSNNPDAVWVFKIGTQLNTTTNSTVQLINQGQSLNVFWQVGDSATLNGGTRFHGNLLAMKNITLMNGASLLGRAFGLTGVVTMYTADAPAAISNTPFSEFIYAPLVWR